MTGGRRAIPPRRRIRVPLTIFVSCLWALSLPSPCSGAIHPADVVAGPANTILSVDGTALAPDGSGGLLYSQVVDGVVHLFAVPFANGTWGQPVEVDQEDAYGASQATIAAGDGGRLLVVWVQPRNVSPGNITEYELMGASLQPGAGMFGQAVAIDTSVGEPDTGDVSGIDPRLAMAPDGEAYVVYRAIADDCSLVGDEGNAEEAKCRPNSTDEVVHIRVARYDYLTWSSLGTINRAPQIALLKPTSENAPSIGIALNGNGVVAWQEPETSGVGRIWVRRLFGTTLGTVLQASPETVDGRPVTSNAEAPAVAVGPFGETRVAFRIQGGHGSGVQTSELFVNSLESELAIHGSQLQGATALAGTAQADVGVPSDAIVQAEEAFRIAWTQGGEVRQLAGTASTTAAASTIGASDGQALTTLNPAGGSTTAWTAPSGAPPAVDVREDYAQGAYQTAQLAGGVPGPVNGLSLGADGEGDALFCWMQGPEGAGEVVGDFVQAPPAPFTVITPEGWIRAPQATVEWEPSADAVAGVTYSVYVDGHAVLRGLTGLRANLSSAVLGDGVHRVRVLATDPAGGQTLSDPSTLMIAAYAPLVRARLIDGGRGVRVTVTDTASGVDANATEISFGDGHHLNGYARASHRYLRAGRYTITAQVSDRAGNHATVRLRVRVR